VKLADDDPVAEASGVPPRRLLDGYSNDLTVIGNDPLQKMDVLGPAGSALKGIKDVVEAVVDVVGEDR
jgi:hypothetical protein